MYLVDRVTHLLNHWSHVNIWIRVDAKCDKCDHFSEQYHYWGIQVSLSFGHQKEITFDIQLRISENKSAMTLS